MPTIPRRAPLGPLLAILATLAVAAPASAQTRAERIDALARRYHEVGLLNGAVLVAEDGEPIYAKGFGDAVREWDVPNGPDTKFRIGSVTKQFTAALVLQQVEEGTIDLQGTIRDYLPEYPPKQGDRVTIDQLLSHTSGIPSYTGLGDIEDFKRDPVEPDSFIHRFWDLDLEFEPGSRWSYSNSGYYLLGVILERVTGEPYERLLRERLLDPLGLDDTGYDDVHAVVHGKAEGYAHDGLGYRVADYLDSDVPYSAGMMYSTPRDLLKWDRVLSTPTGPFREAATMEAWFAPRASMGQGSSYAYGWVIQPTPMGADTIRVVQHGGGIDGFTTAFWRIPADRRTIVVMDNTAGTRTEDLARDLARILYDQPVEPPNRPIADVVGETIDAEGWEAAVARYRELRRTAAGEYDFDENQLNRLGYHYLNAGDVETAIRVFELNVEAYPEAFNPWDSLAEAYMEAGDREKAVEYYRKSLALNPGNANAKRMLRDRLGAEDAAPAVEVPEPVLERYVGRYALTPTMELEITRAEDGLFAQATGQPKVELVAASETEFFVTGVEARIVFDDAGDGLAPGLTLFQGGREIDAPRVEE